MGEYARYQGTRVKIGTCESMYYLRADQAEQVGAESSSVDPIAHAGGLRFRFPFPSEDGMTPGSFDYPLPDDVIVEWEAPADFEHSTVSVETRAGTHSRLSADLPCPTIAPGVWHPYVRDNKPGVVVHYQGVRGAGVLAVIVSCRYCDAMWNLPTVELAESLVVALRSQADRLRQLGEHRRSQTLMAHGPDVGDPLAESEIARAATMQEIATRIMAGYTNPPKWVGRVPVSA